MFWDVDYKSEIGLWRSASEIRFFLSYGGPVEIGGSGGGGEEA